MMTRLIRIAVFVLPLITVVMAQGGGYALDFDGSNDYVEVPYASAINPTSYTVSAWAKVEGGSGDWRSVITSRSETGSNDKGYTIYAGNNDTWQFWTGTGTGTNIDGGSWHQINSGVSVGSGWAFLTATYDGTTMKFYVNGVQKGGNLDASAHKNTTEPMRIGAGKTEDTVPEYYFNGKIDEIRIWNDVRTQSEIREYMHKEVASDESGLVANYRMSDGSGTSLADDSDNIYTGTLTNMEEGDWVTSYAPIGDLNSSYETDVEGIWSVSGTSASDASDGLTMTVGSTLSTGNFAVYGNNNTSGTSTSDLGSVGSSIRTGRIWQVDESGTVAGTVTIDISDATGNSGQSGTASNYRLLYRSGTSGDFSSAGTGASISGDAVSFTSISLEDGYYALGGESDAYLTPYVTISGSSDHFRMMSSPVAGTVYDDILGDLWIQGMTNGDTESGTANVWTYDGSSWNALSNLNTASQTAGAGFLVYVYTDTDNDGDDDLPVTPILSGTANTSDVDVTTTYDANTTGGVTSSGWNLLGNPYASTIDADASGSLFDDNTTNFNEVVYVWHSQASTPAYISWNESSGSLTNGLIAPYQGFWVQGKSSSATTYTFDYSDCISSSGGTFYKTMSDSTGSMSFSISSGNYTDQAFVSFMNNGEEGIDGSDAYKLLPMTPSERVVGISYAEGNGLDISNLPYSHEGSIAIPLDVMYLTVDDDYNFVTIENDVTMSWDVSSLPGHVSLTLTDNATGTAVNLTEESEITFSTEAKGSFPAYGSNGVNIYPQVGESQFTLSVAYSALTTNDDMMPKEFALHPAYPNPFNPTATITFDVPAQTHSNASLRIYDITGRLVATLVDEQLAPGTHTLQWQPVNLSSGLYIVQLKAGEKIFNQKITFIK